MSPGPLLLGGIVAVAAVALTPAGLRGEPVPAWSWALWGALLVPALALRPTRRRLRWLLPLVLLFALPALLGGAAAARPEVAAALVLRALAAASLAAGLAALLGPTGLVAGARALRLPPRLVAILEAMLVSLTTLRRQTEAMLRARAARRAARSAWGDLAAEPRATLRGYGRLLGALLLRALERAEAQERARRARGIGA